MAYPIVLAHGVCRFDKLWNDALAADNTDDPELDLLHYFKGVRHMLLGAGFHVRHASTPWAASVAVRSLALKQEVLATLQRTGADKVNIVAHSMGGLDSRHMLFNDRAEGRVHERVASLTTISTPHWGSPFADWGTNHLPTFIKLLGAMGVGLEAMQDLRTDTCRSFNEDPQVRAFEDRLRGELEFKTYAGVQSFLGTFGLLKFAHGIISHAEGPNDGLVSVTSARWKDEFFQEEIPHTDHLNELAWWDNDQIAAGEGPNALLLRIHALYLKIARELP